MDAMDMCRPSRRSFLAGTAALLVLPVRARAAPLHLRAASADLPVGGLTLSTPAFNALAAAPLIEARRGEPLTLTVENALDFPFSFLPHGLRGQSVTGHETPLAPGETREIVLTPPDAGTFVYRARSDHSRGTLFLSGPLLVTAEHPPVADSEAVLAVNTVVVPGEDPGKTAHRLVTVNGSTGIDIAARPGERIHLRLVNLAQDSIAGARMPKGAAVIAIDGQPCEPFPPLDDTLFLPPLGRADLVLETAGDAASPLVIRDALDPSIALAAIAVEGEKMPERYLAKALPVNSGLPGRIPLTSAARASWTATGTPPDPLVRVKSGGSVVLTLDAAPHARALTIGGHAARLLDRLDDGWKGWWIDTLLVHPNEAARLAFAAEAPGRYALDLVPLEGDAAPRRAFIEVQ